MKNGHLWNSQRNYLPPFVALKKTVCYPFLRTYLWNTFLIFSCFFWKKLWRNIWLLVDRSTSRQYFETFRANRLNAVWCPYIRKFVFPLSNFWSNAWHLLSQWVFMSAPSCRRIGVPGYHYAPVALIHTECRSLCDDEENLDLCFPVQ